ncbi:MAG: 6-carboxytetrahydropterin synthase QueD [Coriobacteriia bacterium]|nr:6-carboxytetrahydropterin synthase QueD [Coriobacteriia bacterium]
MTSEIYTIYCDGGARNNPGPAGAGFVVTLGDDEVLAAGTYLGETTNNVAEYCGFIWALENADHLGAKRIQVYADSSLMINQLIGAYKVKDMKLRWLHTRARELMVLFETCDIEHVLRDQNEHADQLVNQAIDEKDTVGTFKIDPSDVHTLVADVNGTLFDLGGASKTKSEKKADAAGSSASEKVKRADRDTPDGENNDQSAAKTENDAKEISSDEVLVNNSRGIYSLQVKWHFDAAHRLYNYPGECSELHGHTWEVEATVESDTLNDIEIVYDFKDLKTDLALILDAYDHKLINDVPPFDEISPTAENLARVVFEELSDRIGNTVRVAEVAVWESPVARVGYRLKS